MPPADPPPGTQTSTRRPFRGPEKLSALAKVTRFYVTGGVNTAFGYGIYALTIALGLHPQLAQLLSRVIGIAFNLMTYRSFVFGSSRFPLRRFFVAYTLDYAVSVVFLELALQVLEGPYLAGVATTVFSTALQFFVLSRFLATRSSKSALSAKPTAYRPHRTIARWLPERLLIFKDLIRDTILGLARRAWMTPPGRWVWRLLPGPRLAKRLRDARFLFIHIPKTGGTSISCALYGRNFPHYSAQSYRWLLGDAFNEHPSFAVIREPVARFLSAYRFSVQGGTPLMRTSRFERFRLGRMEPLEHFIERLEIDPPLMRIAPQFAPQTDFVIDAEGHILVQRLWATGTPEGHYDSIAQWLELEAIPHLNASVPFAITPNDELIDRIRRLYVRDAAFYDSIAKAGGFMICEDQAFVLPDGSISFANRSLNDASKSETARSATTERPQHAFRTAR